MGSFIVLVEDDHLQEGPLEDHIRRSFPGATIEILGTEQEFRSRLPEYRRRRPDVVVLDVMLRWSYPSRTPAAPPPDVVEGGYQRAGIRCADLMAADDTLRDVPVIYYTILERRDLERDVEQVSDGRRYVRKSADPEILARKVRELLTARPPSDPAGARPRRPPHDGRP